MKEKEIYVYESTFKYEIIPYDGSKDSIIKWFGSPEGIPNNLVIYKLQKVVSISKDINLVKI